MYSVLIVLLAIVAYHNGIKNSDLDTTAGGASNSKNIDLGTGLNGGNQLVLESVKNDECEPVDCDCYLRRNYENI